MIVIAVIVRKIARINNYSARLKWRRLILDNLVQHVLGLRMISVY